MSRIYLICALTILITLFIRSFFTKLFLLQEIDIFSIFLWDALNLRITSTEYVFTPLLIMKSCQAYPFLKILIFSLYDSLLPFFIMSNFLIGVKTIVPMELCLFVTLTNLVRFNDILSCGQGREVS